MNTSKSVGNQLNERAARDRQETLCDQGNGAKPNKKAAQGPPQSSYTLS
jgi:hypothetical protein